MIFGTGYIDLSKRRVSPEDVISCEDKYTKSKTVHNIMSHASTRTDFPIEQLYEQLCWPLDKKYGHCYDAFRLSISCVLLLSALLLSSADPI